MRAAFDSSITTRGFTGHEMVDGVGIIHMNSRIYDGKIGRFLQADPFIQAPFDTQSLNRYSYVRNNPLNKTDPSGYFVAELTAAVYWAIGTYVVTDLLITLGAENLAALASIAGCASGNQASCAGASFGSNYAFTYDFGKASRAAAISYYSADLYEYVGGITDGAYLANAVANGFVGGIAAELGGGDFGDGFLSAGVSALAKPYIRGIGTDQYSGSRVAVRALLGGTISELTGGKFANGAVSAAMAQLFNAEKTREKNRSDSGFQISDSDIGWLDNTQTALDGAGLFPGLGIFPDGLNVLISAGRGDWAGAGLSAAAMIPIAGQVVTSGKIAKNINRFRKKVPSNAKESLSVRELPNGGVAVQATSPGNVPGSKAVYEKQINSNGDTIQATKTTYDPSGDIVHVKDKLNGGVYP